MKTNLLTVTSLSLIGGIALLATACGKEPLTSSPEEARAIPFSVGRNYRPRPTVPAHDIPRMINDRGVRDCFLTSDTLGGDAIQPTYVDFRTETVVNIILPPTFYPTELSVEAVTVEPDKTLHISFRANREGRSAFEMTPYKMLILKNQDIEGCGEVLVTEIE